MKKKIERNVEEFFCVWNDDDEEEISEKMNGQTTKDCQSA